MPFQLPKDDGRFKLGDTVWIHNGGDEMSDAKIIHIFDHPEHGHKLYVLQIETPMDPYWDCREFGTMSDAPNKPIMFYRGFASA